MKTEKSPEHDWLQKFVGNWQAQGEMPGEDGKPGSPWTASESGRRLGELWLLVEGRHIMPDGGEGLTQFTLGYDSNKKKFVGSWLGSMMDFFWVYEGELSADGQELTLNTEGPRMDGSGQLARYQDIHRFVNADQRILVSQLQDENGQWQPFMEVHYRRR